MNWRWCFSCSDRKNKRGKRRTSVETTHRSLRLETLEMRHLLSASSLNELYVSTEFQLSGSDTQWAYIAGLNQTDISQIQSKITSNSIRETFVGQFVDAEKGAMTPKGGNKSNDGITQMCWGATLANMLWYTGWVNEALALDANNNALFQNEDDVFSYICDSFSNTGGHPWYGMNWFLTGEYEVQGDSRWSQVVDTDSGGFYNGDYTRTNGIVNLQSFADFSTVADALREGDAVGLAVEWGTGNTGHALTAWGYTYDTSYSPNETGYYTGIFVTDSDDSWNGNAVDAPNKLQYYSISWNDQLQNWCYQADSGKTGYLKNITTLSPYVSHVDISTTFSNAQLSASTIYAGEELTLSDVKIMVGEGEQSHAFTISIYASLDDTISTESDILLQTMMVESLTKNSSETFTFEALDTSKLLPDSTYHVGWILHSVLDTDVMNNSAMCASTVSVVQNEVTGITLSNSTCVYDGNVHLPNLSGLQPEDTVYYSLDGVTYTDTISSITSCVDVGTYPIWVMILRDGYLPWCGTATVTITPKRKSMPHVEAIATSISSVEVTVSPVEAANRYELVVARDPEWTNIVFRKTLDEAGVVTIQNLDESSEYYVFVSAIGTGNFMNSVSSLARVTTWERQFDFAIQSPGMLVSDCVFEGTTLTISDIAIANTGRDMSREYTLTLRAISLQESNNSAQVQPIILGTVSRYALESGEVDTLPEMVFSLANIKNGQYRLELEVSSGLSDETDKNGETNVTNNTQKLETVLNVLSMPTIQLAENATKTTSAGQLTEWSSFQLEIQIQQNRASELILVAYDSRIFSLDETTTQTIGGVQVTFQEYATNLETGMREMLVFLKNDTLPPLGGVLEQEKTTTSALLAFNPATSNGLMAGESSTEWLFANGNNISHQVFAFDYDLTDDGIVNILDLVVFARNFGTKNNADESRNSAADFNRDGLVNILDLVLFAKNFNVTMR